MAVSGESEGFDPFGVRSLNSRMTNSIGKRRTFGILHSRRICLRLLAGELAHQGEAVYRRSQ